MSINQEFSFKDFTDKNLLDIPVERLNNTTIKGSCFYQQGNIDSKIFPNSMDGVIFDACNLDNVKVESGNTALSTCSNDKIKVNPSDNNEDWITDSQGAFIRKKVEG